MSSLTSFSSVRFKDDELPLLTEAVFNQQYIEKDGNQIPISNLVLLPQVLASLDLPPNATILKVVDTIALSNPLFPTTNTINYTSLIIDDTAVGGSGYINTIDKYTYNITDTINFYSTDIGAGSIQLTDANGGNPLIARLTADHTADPQPFLLLSTPTATNTIKNSSINLTDVSSTTDVNTNFVKITNSSGNVIDINCDSIQQWINTTCSGIGEINLDCNTNTLFIRNFNSGGFTRLGTDTSIDNSNLILTDNKDLFVNSTTKQFFKFNDAGYGYKPKLVNQDETIQRYMNYVVMDDGITNVYLDTYTNLLDSNTLVPDRERVGWSCKFCNMNNVDVTISNTDGLNYFSHYGGLSGSPYTLKKYSVVELTLLWSGNLGQFLYAVSQYN